MNNKMPKSLAEISNQYFLTIVLILSSSSSSVDAYKYLSCNSMCCECVSTSRTMKADYVRLKNDIFDGYEKHVRPVFSHKTAIPVKVQVRLKALVDVKEAEQTVVISQSFGLGLGLPPDGKTKVTWPELTSFHCDFEVVEFPFDVQECVMTYASWRFSTDEVVAWPVGSGKELIPDFKENGEFELMEFSVDYKNRTGSTGTSAFSEIYFKMERGEKVSMGLTALLTTSVMLLMVSDMMPKSLKGLPRLGSYILWEMTITTLCTVIAVACMYVHSEASFGEPVPRWLLRATGLSHKAPDGSPDQPEMDDDIMGGDQLHRDYIKVDPSSKVTNRERLGVTAQGSGDGPDTEGDVKKKENMSDVTSYVSPFYRVRDRPQVNIRPLLDNECQPRQAHPHSLSMSSLAPKPGTRAAIPVDVPKVSAVGLQKAGIKASKSEVERAHLAALKSVVDHVQRMRRCFDEKQGDDELITLWNLVCYRIDNCMLVLFLTMSCLVTFYYVAL